MQADEPLQPEFDSVMDDLRAALAFLTRLPAGLTGAAFPELPDLGRAARLFPAVGLLVGAAGGVVLALAAAVGMAPFLAASLAVATTIIATGGLHEDGLADTADGFGGGTTRQRRLDIMRDSRIGTYGATALILSILLRVGALAALTGVSAWHAILALIAAEAIARAAMVRFWHELPPARPSGLSSDGGAPDHAASLIAIAIATLAAIVLIVPSLGLGAVVFAAFLAIAACFGFARLCMAAIDGRTGDTLGACQQIAAVVFLVGLSAFA